MQKLVNFFTFIIDTLKRSTSFDVTKFPQQISASTATDAYKYQVCSITLQGVQPLLHLSVDVTVTRYLVFVNNEGSLK